jgi:hypothetical protein
MEKELYATLLHPSTAGVLVLHGNSNKRKGGFVAKPCGKTGGSLTLATELVRGL